MAFVPEAFTPVAHILIGRTRAAGQTQMMRAYADRIQRHAAATGVAMGGMLLLATVCACGSGIQGLRTRISGMEFRA